MTTQENENEDLPPTIEECFKAAEEIVSKIELLGYMMTDTPDFKKLDKETMNRILKELRRFYNSTRFHSDSLRDELQLAIQAINKVNKNG